MPRVETIRKEVQRLLRATPFQPFALSFESGDRVIIGHPENIAFEPDVNGKAGSDDFYVMSNKLRIFSTFNAVTTVALADRGELH